MHTYITEKIVKTETKYGFYTGQQIRAANYTEAEASAKEQGLTIVGKIN